MKVETFLQHCNSREKFTPEEEADARKFFADRGVRYIRDWYSQPFKPELITELFDGWERELVLRMNKEVFPKDLLTYTYTNGQTNHKIKIYFQTSKHFRNMSVEEIDKKISKLFDEEDLRYNNIDYSVIENQDIRYKMPLTLDEFILDSTRNGVELKWKEIEAKDE